MGQLIPFPLALQNNLDLGCMKKKINLFLVGYLSNKFYTDIPWKTAFHSFY